MLDTPDLKVLATRKLQMQLKNWVVADFPAMVRELYSTTNKQDKEIRSALVAAAKDHIDELLKMEEFREVIEEFGEFTAALLVVVRTLSPPPSPSSQYAPFSYTPPPPQFLPSPPLPPPPGRWR